MWYVLDDHVVGSTNFLETHNKDIDRLEGITVPLSSNVKYLGVILCERLYRPLFNYHQILLILFETFL